MSPANIPKFLPLSQLTAAVKHKSCMCFLPHLCIPQGHNTYKRMDDGENALGFYGHKHNSGHRAVAGLQIRKIPSMYYE